MQGVQKRSKKLTKTAVFGAMLAVLFSLAGCFEPENNRNYRLVETDYFRCAVHKTEDSAIVYELTDLGKEQEVLAIPDSVNGKPVTQIGWREAQAGWGGVEIGFESENLKKVYIPYTIRSFLETALTNCELEEMVVISENSGFFDVAEKVIISQKYYEFLFQVNSIQHIYAIANLYLYFNYEDSPNSNHFWIDLITGDNIYLAPPQPTRENYTFTGWYFESDCTTQWDGVLPASGDEKLELYAGWVEN